MSLLDEKVQETIIGPPPLKPDEPTLEDRAFATGPLPDDQVGPRLWTAPWEPPAKARKALDVSTETGIPSDIAYDGMEHYEQRKRRDEATKLQREAPRVARWMAQDKLRMSAASEDLKPLTGIEKNLHILSGGFSRGQDQVELGDIGMRFMAGAETAEDRMRAVEIQQDARRYLGEETTFDEVRRAVAQQTPLAGRIIADSLKGYGEVGGAVALGTFVGTRNLRLSMQVGKAAGKLAGTAYAAGSSFNLNAGMAMMDFMAMKTENGRPMDRDVARVAAGIIGAVDAGLDTASLGYALSKIPGLSIVMNPLERKLNKEVLALALAVPSVRNAFKRFALNFGKSTGVELGTEMLQTLTEYVGTEQAVRVDEGKSGDPTDKFPRGNLLEQEVDTFKEILLASPLYLPGPSMTFAMDYKAAVSAHRNARTAQTVIDHSLGAKMRVESPTQWEKAVDSIAPEAKVAVPVDAWIEHFQSIDEDPAEAAEKAMGERKSFDDALKSGHDLVMPLSSYVAHVADQHEGLKEDLRLTPKSMTLREAKDWEKRQPEILKAMQEANDPTKPRPIYDAVKKSLIEAGHDEVASDFDALLTHSVYTALAVRMGTGETAEQLFERFGRHAVRKRTTATQGEQVSEHDQKVLGVPEGTHIIQSAEEYRQFVRRYGLPNAIDVGKGIFGKHSGALFVDDDADGKPVGFAWPDFKAPTERAPEDGAAAKRRGAEKRSGGIEIYRGEGAFDAEVEGGRKGAVFFTPDRDYAENYYVAGGTVMELSLPEDVPILDLTLLPERFTAEEFQDFLDSNGVAYNNDMIHGRLDQVFVLLRDSEEFLDALEQAGFAGWKHEEISGKEGDTLPFPAYGISGRMVDRETLTIRAPVSRAEHDQELFQDAPGSEKETATQERRRADYPETMAALEELLTDDEKALLSDTFVANIDELLSDAGTGKIATPEEIAAMARAGGGKRGWYARSTRALAQIFGKETPRFVALLASFSPRTDVESDLLNTLLIWKAWKAAGSPTSKKKILAVLHAAIPKGKGPDAKGMMKAWEGNAITALTTKDPLHQRLSGPKVEEFRKNLLGDTEAVTLDAWMATALGMPQELFGGISRTVGKKKVQGLKGHGYLFGAVLARKAAKLLSESTGGKWTPAEVQETVWSWVLSIYELRESARGKTTRELISDDRLQEQITRTPDFGILLADQSEKYRKIVEDSGYGETLAKVDQNAGTAATSPLTADEERSLGRAADRIERVFEARRRSGAGIALARRVLRTRRPGSKAIGPFIRRGAEDGGRARLEPDDYTREVLRNVGIVPPTFIEADAVAFHTAITAASTANVYGASVFVYPDYSGMQTYLTEDGTAGFALKGDDIVSVFKAPGSPHKGFAISALTLATQMGGRRLDAFDTALPGIYAEAGFVPVSRMDWNEKAAPPNWPTGTFMDFNEGEPDVVYMAWAPMLSKQEREGFFKSEAIEDQYVDSTSEAVAEQDQAIKSQREVTEYYQDEPTPGPIFYSKAVRVAEALTQKSATTERWLTLLRNGGVKNDEIDTLGLKEWLDSLGREATREEVADFIRANQLEVSETLLSERSPDARENLIAARAAVMFRRQQEVRQRGARDPSPQALAARIELHGDTLVLSELSEAMRPLAKALMEASQAYSDEKQADLDDARREKNNKPLYARKPLVIEGGKGQKELMITLPTSPNNSETYLVNWRVELVSLRNADIWVVTADRFNGEAAFGPRAAFPAEAFSVNIGAAEAASSQDAIKKAKLKAESEGFVFKGSRNKPFRSGHYPKVPNVIVHVRFNERTDADGKRVLFIEEVQSDWHQQGAKEGYVKDPAEALSANLKRRDEIEEELFQLNIKEDDGRGKLTSEDRNRRRELGREHAVVLGKLADEIGAILDAPFKTTWNELAMKRMLRWAVENGFDSVAWTTGEQQAERYDLSKQIKELKVDRVPDGYVMYAYDTEGDAIESFWGDVLSEEELPGVVGKEMAEKIISQAEDSFMYSGLELKVGGKGMKVFYDEKLVNSMNKYVKKWGAKVAPTTLSSMSESDNRPIGQRKGPQPPTTFEAHGLQITDAMRESVMQGQELFQETRQGKRGSISKDPSTGLWTINLFEKHDPSTFLHESGHLWLEMLGDLAEESVGPTQLRADYEAILKFLGVSNRSEITREHHEKFAKSFENYLYSGVAPSLELRSAFARFKAWLTSLYRNLPNYFKDSEVTPELKDVFDRLVATEDEIAAAQGQQHFVPIFSTAEMYGLTPEAFEVYKAAVQAARMEAEERLTVEVLSVMRRERKEWWREQRARVRGDVAKDVQSRPVYRALAFLQKGTMPDGSPLPEGVTPQKISRAALVEVYGEEFLKKLPKPWVYSVEGGASQDLLAPLFGFANGDALVQALISSPKMDRAIEAETSQKMRELHGDPMTDGTMTERAMLAVHNEKQAELLAAELRGLRRKMREGAPHVAADRAATARQETQAKAANEAMLPAGAELRQVREEAQLVIGATKLQNIRPHVYRQAEAQAGRLAFEAAAKGDWQTAYTQKLRQIKNHELHRAATEAVQESEKIRAYFSKFKNTRVRERLGMAGDGLLERIELILSDLNLQKMSNPAISRRQIRDELLAAIKAGEVIVPPEGRKYLEGSDIANYRERTIEELRGLRDIVKQLEARARAASDIVLFEENVKVQESIDAVAGGVLAHGKPIKLTSGTRTLGAKAKHTAKETLLAWLSPAGIAKELDGGDDFGPVFRYIILPIRRAYAELLLPMKEKARDDVTAIYRKHYTLKELSTFTRRLPMIEGIAPEMTFGDLLVLAMNWGNEGNRKAVLDSTIDGEKIYTQDGVNRALAMLTERDLAFVQDVWDYLDTYYPLIAQAEKRRRGISPKQVEASAFTLKTADGKTASMRGGYFPIKFDPTQSTEAAGHELDEYAKAVFLGASATSVTQAGATIERVGSAGKPVLLILNVIDTHLDEVIRDLALGDAVRYVDRVLRSRKVRSAFTKTGNQEALQALELWLQDSAAGELPANHAITKGIAWAKVGFVKSRLAWNASVTFLQLSGITQSISVLDSPEAFRQGTARYAQNPLRAMRDVLALSKFMHARYELHGFNKDVSETRAFLRGAFGPVPTRMGVAMDAISSTYMLPIAKMQQQVDTVTWLAGYWKGIEEKHLPPEDAILYADSVVEASQTSGFFSDRSGIERGTINARVRQQLFVKLFTTLISFMLRTGNIAYAKGRQFARKPTLFGAVTIATDIMLLYMIPALFSAALKGRLPDDDDDEGWGEWMTLQTLEAMASGIPGVRQIANARYGGGSTAIDTFFGDIWNLGVQAKQWEADPAFFRALNNVGGIVIQYPSTMINRVADAYWRDTEGGEDVPWYEYLVGKGNRGK